MHDALAKTRNPYAFVTGLALGLLVAAVLADAKDIAKWIRLIKMSM